MQYPIWLQYLAGVFNDQPPITFASDGDYGSAFGEQEKWKNWRILIGELGRLWYSSSWCERAILTPFFVMTDRLLARGAESVLPVPFLIGEIWAKESK